MPRRLRHFELRIVCWGWVTFVHHSVAKVHVRLLLALGYDSSEYFIFFIPLNTFGFGHITWPTLHLFTFEFNESSRAPGGGGHRPQPLGALRDVSYQLFCGDEILESAFEQRPDMLCVARQLAELMRLPVQEVLSDFDAITNGSKWREQGITPREIRSFCVWRQAPMFYVDCQGRLLDKFEPAIKEQRAVAFTSW